MIMSHPDLIGVCGNIEEYGENLKSEDYANSE
jgi:hypothetical protein